MTQSKKLLDFFNQDQLAADVWYGKYRFGDEETPDDMDKRHVKEFLEKEMERFAFEADPELFDNLSRYGQTRFRHLFERIPTNELRKKLEANLTKLINLNTVVLSGSPMQGIGRHNLYSSLSNCFVVGQPYDSYSGINLKRHEITEMMKRRGGAGADLSTIRPRGASVHNQASVSSGVVLFANGFSNQTLEIAQEGRRGALMLSLNILHPDSLEFIESKQDLTKITGANISTGIPDEFMEAIESDSDILLRFPVDSNVSLFTQEYIDSLNYNELYNVFEFGIGNYPEYVKKIKAKDYWDTLIECAWTTAEPGILFLGNWKRGGPDWVYEKYRPVSTNPCSEIPMSAYDACRLLSVNTYKLVKNPFTKNASISNSDVYSIFYEQLIIGDILVDLELDYIDRIIGKIKSGKDPEELKHSEIIVWEKVKDMASSGRRCGAGFTAFGDMLAALNLPYYSPAFIEELFRTKMEAELDATIDLAILYGTFDGFNQELEKKSIYNQNVVSKIFPDQYKRMMEFGRRNVSWSTAAPVGSGSILTQSCSGIECLFKPFYKRRKKCVKPTDRVDYIDSADGQKFSEYFVLHPKFIEWFSIVSDERMQIGGAKVFLENLKEPQLNKLFEKSPWYGSCADDLNWKQRVEIQSIVQTYTTHAISSTINLPKDIEKSVIGNIYMSSWKAGLKGNTVYRDGSRNGILSSSSDELFVPQKAIKRPNTLVAHYHTLRCNKTIYSIIIGLFEGKPYEIFIISGVPGLPQIIDETNEFLVGEIVKESKNWYNFVYDTFLIKEITDVEHDEKLISILLSGLMAHRTPMKSIIKILDKTQPIAGSFTHRLIKILKHYVPKDEETVEVCPVCGGMMKHDNGCVLCIDCGHSKC